MSLSNPGCTTFFQRTQAWAKSSWLCVRPRPMKCLVCQAPTQILFPWEQSRSDFVTKGRSPRTSATGLCFKIRTQALRFVDVCVATPNVSWYSWVAKSEHTQSKGMFSLWYPFHSSPISTTLIYTLIPSMDCASQKTCGHCLCALLTNFFRGRNFKQLP